MEPLRESVLLIAGPTATGKSSLGIRLAHELDGEIINIDSVQLYRELSVGSARVLPEEMEGVPHHLLGVLSPSQQGSAAWYVREARQLVRDIAKRGRLPIFVGGTGMYVTALFHGLAELPERDEQLRARLSQRPLSDLYQELVERDPESAAKLHPNDQVRIIRALEICLLSGATASAQLDAHAHQDNHFSGLMLVLCRERDDLYNRINRRTEQMLHAGLLDECRGLVKSYGSDAPALRTLGYAQSVEHLNGEFSLSETEQRISMQTRRFAKRQMTFWRNEPRKRGWNVEPGEEQSVAIVGNEQTTASKPREQRKGFAAYDFALPKLVSSVRARLQNPFDTNEVWYLRAGELEREASQLNT